MEEVQIFWDPNGIELNSLNKKTISGDPADGDSPYIRMPIRMLGIDTPETRYGGLAATGNRKLSELADFLKSGKFDAAVNTDLKNYLIPKIENNAGTLQINQGLKAKEYFKNLLDTRLRKPNGSKRSLFVKSADQYFDSYGRLLAYVAPSFSKTELVNLTPEEKKTFNLLMIESGWAATIMIYPNLPKNSDLRLTIDHAKIAYEERLGAWADVNMLTGYEYRMCIKLYQACKNAKASEGYYINPKDWIGRFCLDVTTLKIYNPQEYIKVPPYNRLFIWASDVRKAVGEVNLIAAE